MVAHAWSFLCKKAIKNLFLFRKKLMTLSKAEFLRRFAQHILSRGFMKISSYGIFGNHRRKTRNEKAPYKRGFLFGAFSPTRLNVSRWQHYVFIKLQISLTINSFSSGLL
jgi:hypothetical protein